MIGNVYYYREKNKWRFGIIPVTWIYVEPNKVRANNSTIGQSTTIWFSVISILTSLTSLIVNIAR